MGNHMTLGLRDAFADARDRRQVTSVPDFITRSQLNQFKRLK
jgi:hypothetical protein